VQNLPLITMSQVEEEDKDVPGLTSTMHALFKSTFESYLEGLEESPVRTLKELVERNREIPEELPSGFSQQDLLEKDLDYKFEGSSPEEAADNARARARKRLDDTFSKHDIDVIVGPGDSPMTNYAASAGYPIATLPVGVLEFNGRPFGLTVIAKAHGEPMLIKLQSAWEKLFPRKLPESLKKVEEDWVKDQVSEQGSHVSL
jgi:amidase